MARILIVGKGGYGDMFPLFSIAQALQGSGHVVAIAAEHHHAPACTSIGVPLIPIATANAPANMSESSTLSRLTTFTTEVFRTLAPVSIEDEYEQLAKPVQSSDIIIGNQLAYSGAIAAKRWKKPWVFCAPSPLAIPSFVDPPLFPYLHRLQQIARRQGISQKHFIHLARHASVLAMHANIRLQKRLNVYDQTHPRFEGMYSGSLNLLPVSPTFLSPQTDWPTHTVLTGFNWFEPTFMRNAHDLDRIAAFLNQGYSPVVIAPGGIKRTQPGQFFEVCLAACKLLGLRAIVIASKRFHDQIPASPDVLVSGYVPYSALFGGASAVVHSGGIGTIGWSMKYALPSLLVPTDWDQFDNADRAQRHNFAAVIQRQNFKAAFVADALDRLLKNTQIKNSLSQASQTVALEDGASVALGEIEELLQRL